MPKPKSKLKKHLLAEEARLLTEALEANQWIMLRAARTLDMTFSSFQRAMSRHPKILETYRARNKPPGKK